VKLQKAVDDLVAAGTESEVQVAVYRDGELATAGTVEADALFHAASTAKGIAATVAHALVDRGALAYDTRVAGVWPEFAAHGKGSVTLRDLLLHTAGLPGLPPDITPEGLCDRERVCAWLARQPPWWPPGTETGYHALTFGFLLDETVRRATGRSLSTALLELVTQPLGIADEVHFAVPSRLLSRVVRQVPGDVPAPEPGSPLSRAVPPGVAQNAGFANRDDVLTAEIPSMGTMSARGAARVYAALLGHVPGVTLVSAALRDRLGVVAFEGTDRVMGFPTAWGFGYAPVRPGGVEARPGSAFGMVGSNGSAAWADIDAGVAVAVMRNRYSAGDLAAVRAVDHIVAGSDGAGIDC
jgi:CubicO group peptidase (beta-lactamase class C family)